MRVIAPLLVLAALFVTAGCAIKPLHALDRQMNAGVEATFSPDGRRVAAGDVRGDLRVWSTASGREVARFAGYPSDVRSSMPVRRIAFSPDGRHIAFAADDGSVRVCDVASGREVLRLRGHATNTPPPPPREIVFTPDDRIIVVSGGQAHPSRPGPHVEVAPLSVATFDASTGGVLSHWTDADSGALAATMSADGARVATVAIARDGRRGEVIVRDAAGGAVIDRRVEAHFPYHVALSCDGRIIFTSTLGDLNTGRGWGVLRGVTGGDEQVVQMIGARFAWDGRTLGVIAGATRPTYMSPFYLIGLPIPPPPGAKVRVSRVDLSTLRLTTREQRTSTTAWPIAWSDDLSMFIDSNLRLWRLAKK